MKKLQVDNEKGIAAVIDELFAGGRLADGLELSDEELEGLYAAGYTCYNSRQYEQASALFYFLCLMDNIQKKYWFALAATQKMQKRYQEAIKTYETVGILDIYNPAPPLHAADCYVFLGEKEKALRAVEAVIALAADKTEYRKHYARARTLEKKLKPSKTQ